jgi:hypothetical protein
MDRSTEDHAPDDAAPASIDSRASWHAALRDALRASADAGVMQLWCCDTDFADWPMGEPAWIETLTQWAGAHRRLTLLAADYSLVPARYPRWVAWRRSWTHVVQCLEVCEEDVARVPSLLFAPELLAVRLHDPVQHRGRVYRLPIELLHSRELIDALSQRASEAFPVTTLGL